jgi:hypothetical protein
MQNLFGPLSKQYCLYFYILSVLSFVFLIFVLITLVIGIAKRKGAEFYTIMILGAGSYAMYYFQNRLLHSMCVGSI